jgi:ribosome maturation factor RimP
MEIAVRRERGRSLLLLYPMSSDTQIQTLTQRIEALISAEPDLFLVEVKIKPTNNIKIFIDGNQGVSIDKLVQYNRRLYRQLEEENIYPNGDFSLEVSSPGVDEPLKLHRQYLKNIGRFAEIIDKEEVKKEGKLISATETEVVLEVTTGKGKKMEIVQHTIPFDHIKTTKIQIKF